MTRGSLPTFSMTNEVAEYSAAIPFLVQTAQRRVNRFMADT
jgi:high-affinity K+ transport system ATPase subunit B